MNLNKLFLRWIAVFGMVMVFTVSGWGVCSGTNTGSWNTSTSTYSQNNLNVQSDDQDYYPITIGTDGILGINVKDDDNGNWDNLVVNIYSDSNCNTSIWNGSTTTRNDVSTISFSQALSAGNYVLHIAGTSSSDNTQYDLSGTFSFPSPEINVQGNGNSITDGDTTPSTSDYTILGSIAVGQDLDRTFTIQNTGTMNLTIGAFTLTGDFALQTAPAATVAAGGSTTFTIRFSPTAIGTRNGTLSFVNNDSDENPYNFSIQGTGLDPILTCPGQVISNLHGASSSVTDSDSGTISANSMYYYYFIPAADGRFDVDSSMTDNDNDLYIYSGANCNSLTNVTSDVQDSNNKSLTTNVTAGTRYIVAYYNDNGGGRDYSMNFTFTRNSLSEINVVGVADGGTDASIGTAMVSSGSVDKTYTIENTGSEALSVGTVTISGTHSSDFSVTAQPATSVAAGGTTTFTVHFDPSALGTRTATLSFSNNDANENPYNFSISGMGDGPPIMGTIPNQVYGIALPVDVDLSTYVTLTNGDPILSYTLTGTLPTGLTFNSTTGNISGTASSLASPTSFSVYATDEDGDSNVVNFTIEIATTFGGLHSFDKINPQSTHNVRGNYGIAGNTMMCLTDKQTGTSYEGYGGNCLDTGAELLTSNIRVSKYIDIDGDSSTWNSTSSYVNVPATFDNTPDRGILWAGLFWQGRISNDTDHPLRYGKENGSSYDLIETGEGVSYGTIDLVAAGANSIKLKINNGSYNSTTANTFYEYSSGGGVTYAAYSDVTSIVQSSITASGKHTFTVANLTTNEGREDNPGIFGGWSLVVIYAENNLGKTRNISVYSGFDIVDQPSDAFKITDFKLPTTDLVNATLSLFSGEGEYLYGYRPGQTDVFDWVKISNDGITYQYMPGATTNQNIFDAKFDGILRDNVTGHSNNLQINNDGVDIDNYDVSNLMTTYRDANPDMHEMYIQWSSNQDYITPSMITFATELYAPKLCYDYSYKQDGHYLKADNNGSQLPLLAGTVNDSEIEVSVYIRNIEADIDASNVSFHTSDVNSTLFSYVNNSIASSNVNGSVLIPRDDSGTGCGYDDTATTPIGCVNGSNVRIGLGKDATGYSINGAGNFGSENFTYAKFALKPNFSGLKDLNESLGLSVDYTIRPDGVDADIEYNYKLGIEMDMCPPSVGYTPAWGTFNVIDRNAGTYASNGETLPTNNLYTQVSRKPFAVDVAAYGKYTDGTYTIRPTADINTTVLVEMIDNDAFHDTNASCANPDSNVSQAVYVPLTITAGASGDMTDPVPTQLIPYYNFAVKNASFRIWYFNDKNDLLIQNWTAGVSDPDYKLNLQSISGLYKSDTHTLCASGEPAPNCSNPLSTDCFECIRRNYAKPLCSRDNFAVRPESYDLRIYDVNQTLIQTDPVKDATKIDLSTLFQYAPMFASATDRINIAAGYNYRYDMNATGNDNDLAKVPGYTRYFNGANTDYNATMIWEPEVGHITTGCNDTVGKNLSFYVGNGQMLNSEQNQTQVGEYRLNIIDPGWTAVDWDTEIDAITGVSPMSHHTTGFQAGLDCDSTSTSTTTDSDGKVGCITSSEHTGGGYTYKDHLLRLKPAQFDLSNIAYGVGKIPLSLGSGDSGYVYNSNLGVDNDMPMAVHSYGPIKAAGYGGETLSNFVKECYATDLNLSISHDANISLPFIGRMSVAETNGTQVFDSLKFSAQNNAIQTIEDTYFIKDDNGTTVPTIRLNFDRNATTVQEPQVVYYGDLNVSCLVASDCNMSAAFNTTPNTAFGSDLMDFNVTHVYGRVIARNVRATVGSAFDALAQYEVYNTPTLLGTVFSADSFDTDWYINTQHSIANYGDARITVIDPTYPASYDVNGTLVGGNSTYHFNAITVRQGYKAHIDTEGWLWSGGINALPYADPNSVSNLDCLTHPCFNISFGRIIGNTGSAKTESEDHKANKSTTSTGWSTTSEYAPATR
ncbi:choice-of-anchor D domain-containing protein [Sulfuricurvum sp.]|uniref:choice-of-anchor D domain-containing protein n=1 Tax=Sulfuricurvum sp. TaxID=2025608 RepID=UPI00260D3EB9|nr:choice-of-anchor D domain-containing protein [Sulfuricurvum sp.]MDD2781750.1 choice-of-anchor D domain-containing protein [Sulfuricurvum sp.]